MSIRKIPTAYPTLTDWNKLTDSLGDYALVPMSYAVWQFCRKQLTRGEWVASFYDEIIDDKTYRTPEETDPNWITWKDELNQTQADWQDFMTKFTDLLDSQAGIEDAIRDLQEILRVAFSASGINGGLSGELSTGYPINTPFVLDPSLTPAELSNGNCDMALWLWESFVSICTELDDLLGNFVRTDIGALVISVSEIANSLIHILPDSVTTLIYRNPGMSLANLFDYLDEVENPTITAINDAIDLRDIQGAFAWIDNVLSGAPAELAKIVVSTLGAIGLDSTKWANLTHYEECGAETASLGEVVYTGPDPETGVGQYEAGVVGACGNDNRYTVYGEANCEIRMPIIGSFYGKTTITMDYMFYFSAGTGYVKLCDGLTVVTETTQSCAEQIVLVVPYGLTNPCVYIGCSDTNGADFFPVQIALS